MKRMSKIIMAIGTIIALLAACCLDSPGAYGYLAGAVAILGGFIAGAGYGIGMVADRRQSCRMYLVKLDEPDVVWIETNKNSTHNSLTRTGAIRGNEDT